MTKWLIIFLLLLSRGAFAQQQFTVYSGPNDKQQSESKFFQNDNAKGAAVRTTEDTSSNHVSNTNEISTMLQNYKKALALKPDDTLLLYQIGHCFAADTTNLQKDSALKYYNKAISKSQAFYDAYLDRGYLYALQFGSYKKAHKDFEKSIEIKPINRYSYLYNGMLYFNEKEYKKAKQMYDKAIALYPDFGEAYYERSFTWYAIGINTMVCSDLNTAAKLGFAKAEEAKNIYCQ
jgi:tetratricopeptide (TPR) repeat protein